MSNESVGSVSLDLILNSNEFNTKLNNAVNKATNNINSKMNKGLSGTSALLGKIGKLAAGAFAVSSMVKFGKEAIELGSNLSEVQNVVDSTFTTMSKKVDEYAKTSITRLGMSETSYKKMMGTMGAMSKSFGFSEEQALNMADSITALTADVASFYNLSHDEAYTKMKSIYTGETESLKDLGVVMTQAALDEFALANGFGKTTKAMNEQEKVALRYQFVMKNLETASGDFQRTSNGWANQTKILSEQFNALKASIGQGLINALLPVVRVLNTLMEKLVVLGNMFSNFTAKIFGKAEATTSQVASSVDSSLSGVVDSANSASDAIEGVADATKKASKTSFGFDELNTLQAPDDSSSSGAIGGGTGSSTITEETKETNEALDEQETILDKVLKKFKEFDLSNLKKSFENLKDSITPIIDLIGKGLKWAFDNILVPFGKWTIEEALPSTFNALAGAFDLIGAVAKNVGPKLEAIWDNFLSPIMGFVGDAITSALDGIGEALSNIANNEIAVDILGDLVLALGGIMLYSKVSTIVLGIATSITTLGTSLKILASGGLLESTSIFGKLANTFALVSGGAGTLHEAMTLVFGKITTILTGIGAIIGGAVIAVKNFFDMWSNGWNILDGILTAIGVAIAAVGAIILGAPALVTGVIAAIIAVVANLVVIIKDNWESIKTFTLNIFSSIGKFFSDCWTSTKDTVSNLTSTLVSTVKRNWEGLKESTILIFNNAKNFITECWNNVKSFLTTTITSIVNFVVEKWTEFKNKLSSLISNIRDFLVTSWTTIKDKVISTISNIVDTGKQKFEDFKNGAISIFTSIKDFLSNLWTSIGTFVSDKISLLKDKALSGFNMIRDGANSIFTGMKDTISSIFSGIVNIIKIPMNSIISIINKAIDGINGMSIDVPDWVPLIGGSKYSFNLPRIPALANGAYLTQPTLAMVGEAGPEIVAPEDKMRQIEKEGSSETNALLNQMIQQNQQMMQIMSQILAKDQTINLDGYQMATVLTNIQNSENRRRG